MDIEWKDDGTFNITKEDTVFYALMNYRNIFAGVNPHTGVDKHADVDMEPLSANDIGLIKADIDNKFARGWNSYEIFQYLKNMEEIDPALDEDTALSRMKSVCDGVTARLFGDTVKNDILQAHC